MPDYLTPGQPVTREVIASALIEANRDRGAVKVHVLCVECGCMTTTWLRTTDEVVPGVLCYPCQRTNEAG